MDACLCQIEIAAFSLVYLMRTLDDVACIFGRTIIQGNQCERLAKQFQAAPFAGMCYRWAKKILARIDEQGDKTIISN